MTMTTEQVARLRATLEFVTSHPERWAQSVWYRLPTAAQVDAEPGVDWTCGTSACLAGWTALRAGFVPVDDAANVLVRDPTTGLELLVEDAAADLLGLSRYQAEVLFAAGNNLRDLWEFARVFSDDRLEVPAEVRRTAPLEFDEAYYRDY